MGSGTYIHIPFCTGKCHYCSFVSIPYEPDTASSYLDAVSSELMLRPPAIAQETLYIGGGTPNVLGDAALASLAGHFMAHPMISHALEITVEANPDSLEGFDFGMMADAGVNRVSLGAQSFDRAELVVLGRRHSPVDVEAAVRKIRSAGITNIGIDLIYALPGQDMATWRENLESAARLGPAQLSLYDLSFEEGTPFFRDAASGKISKPPETVQSEMYLTAVEFLAGEGYERYEISNFARPGFECRHNMNYWAGGYYLGYGVSASSFTDGARRENTADIRGYIETLNGGNEPAGHVERLGKEELRRERVMLSLRTSSGVILSSYEREYGHAFTERYEAEIKRLEKAGYIEVEDDRISLTDKGILASSSVISEFF